MTFTHSEMHRGRSASGTLKATFLAKVSKAGGCKVGSTENLGPRSKVFLTGEGILTSPKMVVVPLTAVKFLFLQSSWGRIPRQRNSATCLSELLML